MAAIAHFHSPLSSELTLTGGSGKGESDLPNEAEFLVQAFPPLAWGPVYLLFLAWTTLSGVNLLLSYQLLAFFSIWPALILFLS